MAKILHYSALLLLFSSCLQLDFEAKGLYSNYDQTNRQYPGLIITPDPSTPLCAIPTTNEPKVIVATGTQLRNCLKNYENAAVYVWSPHCKSENCYAIDVLQRECKAKGIELFIVAEYYDGALMNKTYQIDRPIFGVDTKFYNTNVKERYISKFRWELTQRNDISTRLIQFKEGDYVRMVPDIRAL